ncbi:MAG: hypothetical protein NZ888_04890 [Candidatus Nitrosocaldus sp.]|nr:hypothetical protein [Candidatus Nitrosocaldus sp.]MDW7999707.1 hypothetical protein [Candidatus Nitrosocaldus sp.]
MSSKDADGSDTGSSDIGSSADASSTEHHYDIKVYVTGVDAGDVTSMLRGYFTLDGEKIRFRGVAFGRIGGHNVYIKVSRRAEAMLRRMGYDPEHVLVIVQRKMVEGDIVTEH